MKPKLGDRIIVTDPKLDVEYGRECVVIDTLPLTNYIDTKPTEEPKEDVLLTRDQYEVLEEMGVGVVPGSRIIITDPAVGVYFCEIFTIVTVREEDVEVVWEACGKHLFFQYSTFRLLKRDSKSPSSSCSDCNGTGKIQLFTSTVECGCNTR